MSKNTKISIRFFDDREVRAVWDEENNKWWFSVLDIVAVLTDQDDYNKTRNYWKYLKSKFLLFAALLFFFAAAGSSAIFAPAWKAFWRATMRGGAHR